MIRPRKVSGRMLVRESSMAELENNTLSARLVYYGPALSGKTTNIVQLHDRIAPTMKGEIMVLETEGDRTLFFDAFPLGLVAPSGLRVRIKLYTVPGQVEHDSTRKALLSRADGVLFVADLQRHQKVNNGESFNSLIRNLEILGMDPATLPLVVQFNKLDLPGIMERTPLLEKWSHTPWPDLHFASALRGEGVLESFTALLKKVYLSLDRQYALDERHELPMTAFLEQAIGHVEEAVS